MAGAAANSPVQELTAGYSLSNPDSPWVLANKNHPLSPLDYAPVDLVQPNVAIASTEPTYLRADAARAAEKMFAAAAAAGVSMTILSSYRSYQTQVSLYNGYVAQSGQENADTKSARPGYSEHQTGLSMDIGDANGNPACDFNPCFAEQSAAVWTASHGADYGFIVRYQLGFNGISSYYAEPWHLRYVGVELAKDLVNRGFRTYEQYLGMPGAPAYL